MRSHVRSIWMRRIRTSRSVAARAVCGVVIIAALCAPHMTSTGGARVTDESTIFDNSVVYQPNAVATYSVFAGSTFSGQAGNGSTSAATPFGQVQPESFMPRGTQIVERIHEVNVNLARTSSGEVYAWGMSSDGQQGQGPGVPRDAAIRPMLVDFSGTRAAGQPITALATNESAVYALTDRGDVVAWGNAASGKLGNGASSDIFAPVDVDQSAMGAVDAVFGIYKGVWFRASDGRMWGVGDATMTTGIEHPAPGVAIATPVEITHLPFDAAHLKKTAAVGRLGQGGYWGGAFALLDTGELYAWGYDDVIYGHLGLGATRKVFTPTLNPTLHGIPIVDIAANVRMATGMALAENGDVYTWGRGDEGLLGSGTFLASEFPRRVTLPAPAVRISMGVANALALLEDNSLWAWGTAMDRSFGKAIANGQYPAPQQIPTDRPPLRGAVIIEIHTGSPASRLQVVANADPSVAPQRGTVIPSDAPAASNTAPLAFDDATIVVEEPDAPLTVTGTGAPGSTVTIDAIAIESDTQESELPLEADPAATAAESGAPAEPEREVIEAPEGALQSASELIRKADNDLEEADVSVAPLTRQLGAVVVEADGTWVLELPTGVDDAVDQLVATTATERAVADIEHASAAASEDGSETACDVPLSPEAPALTPDEGARADSGRTAEAVNCSDTDARSEPTPDARSALPGSSPCPLSVARRTLEMWPMCHEAHLNEEAP